MNSITPHGWQNLSPSRQRVAARDNILFEIRKIHPDAEEIQIGDDYAYATGENRLLIGIAWQAEQSESWWYAVMSATMFAVGIRCSIINSEGRNRVVPGAVASGIFYQPPAVVKPNLVPTRNVELRKSPKNIEGRKQNAEFQKQNEDRLAQAVRNLYRAGRPASPRVAQESESSALLKRRISRIGGKVMIWVETKDRARELGPFNSRREAILAAETWAARVS